jgi:dUTP pyrophosphatase
MEELNDILNGLSKSMQLDVVKKQSPTLFFVNKSTNPDPCFAKEGDSGFDLRAYLQDNVEFHVEPWRGVIVPTGLYFEVEKGLEIQVRPRSGLARDYWVTVLNTPGTVDSRFRGEIQIIFMNLSDDKFIIKNGDRIAQGVVCPVYGEGNLNMVKAEKLSETERGNNGFGSTGIG